jgi:uncharacterized membrane protein
MRRASLPPPPLAYWQARRGKWARFVAELRARPRTTVEWCYLILWVFYLVSYPIAVTGVAFDVRPGFSMAWAGSILLFVQGALAALWLVQWLGARRGGMVVLAVAAGAFVGETVGVATGFPFGPYRYTDILFPHLPGSVPLPVIGAWLLVVATSVGVAQWVRQRAAGHSLPRTIILATVLGVALDLVLEPVAVKIEGYWVWGATGPYLGLPTSNFVGWAALCFVLCGVVLWAWSRGRSRQMSATVAPLPDVAQSAVWLYGLTDAMFACIDLTHGLWVAAIIGAVTLGCLALRGASAYDKSE